MKGKYSWVRVHFLETEVRGWNWSLERESRKEVIEAVPERYGRRTSETCPISRPARRIKLQSDKYTRVYSQI